MTMKSKAIESWFGDPEKAKQLAERVSAVEEEIEENDIMTRTAENSTEEVEENEVEEVEEEAQEANSEEATVIELDQDALTVIANEVATLLESRLAQNLNSIVDRLAKLEKGQEEVEQDVPKSQKVRFKLQEAIVEEDSAEVAQTIQVRVDKEAVSALRKNRLAAVRQQS